MAMGIVVRVIAPLIRDKHTDPAVVVVDDVGRFVISMLSGHEGGANQLAHQIASILHTDAVITTGTDAQKDIIIGIGCKKGISREIVKKSIIDALQKVNRKIEEVRLLSTIDIKSEEPGLLQDIKGTWHTAESCFKIRNSNVCKKNIVNQRLLKRK